MNGKNDVLTSGRYIGLADEDDDFDFVERFEKLHAELAEQFQEEDRLNEKIMKNLSMIDLKGVLK